MSNSLTRLDIIMLAIIILITALALIGLYLAMQLSIEYWNNLYQHPMNATEVAACA